MKTKVIFSDYFRKQIDNILDRGGKEEFNVISELIKKIEENPRAGVKIITQHDPGLVRDLQKYRNKGIEKIFMEEGLLYQDVPDISIFIDDIIISLIGVRVFDDKEQNTLGDLVESNSKVYLEEIDYCDRVDHYALLLKNRNDRFYVIPEGISVEKIKKTKFES